MSEMEYLPKPRPDPVLPVRIEHLVDEIIIGGELSASYNYLDYHFETKTSVMRGRVYLEASAEMTLFGPFANNLPLVDIDDPDLEHAVRSYAERRFPLVKKLEAK